MQDNIADQLSCPLWIVHRKTLQCRRSLTDGQQLFGDLQIMQTMD